MTVEASPGVLQNKTYSAEIIRRMFGSLMKRGSTIGSIAGGIVGATDCKVNYAGSGLKVIVEPGEIWVPGSFSGSTTQAGYYVRVSAAETLTPTAANATNPRIDTVIARVKDQAYSGTENVGLLEVLAGTPTSGATLANLTGKATPPENSYVLAYVLIPATATTIVTADIENVAAVLSGSLTFQQRSASTNIVAGEYALIELSGSATATLPAPTKGAQVAVMAGLGSTITVNASTNGGKIYGDFVSAANTVILTALQHVELLGTGTTWVIVAGTPAPAVVGATGTTGPNVVSWGQVEETGAASITGSGDWTVAKTGTGEYEVKWNTAKSNTKYVATVTAEGGNSVGGTASVATTGFRVRMTNSGTGAAENHRFGFIVLSAS